MTSLDLEPEAKPEADGASGGKKRNFLPIILLTVLGLWGISFLIWKGFFASRPQRPNIVFIMVDALRADKLGCYGFPEGTSPEIDALAADAVLFENAFSLCSWTRPSMGTMLTGLQPRTLGIYKEETDILGDRFTTLAEALKAGGYWTFGITANPNLNTVFNFQQGFDEYQDSQTVWRWMHPREGEEKVDRRFNLRRCQDIFAEILSKVASKDPRKGPVYVQAVIMEVHTPWIIRPEYKSAYPDYPVAHNIYHRDTKNEENFVRQTLGAVRQVSHDISEFIRRFREIPGRESTLFVITSDHGQGLDDHPNVFKSMTHGNLLYQSHLKVPLIFYQPEATDRAFWRRYRPHRVVERVTLLDFMPTILDYVGLSLPRHPKGTPVLEGRSLIQLIDGEKGAVDLPSFFVAETQWRNLDKIALYNNKCIFIENRDGWKGVNPLELQLLGSMENGTKTDRILEEKATAEAMQKMLGEWLASHQAVKPEKARTALSPEEIEQLKALGYLK